MASLYSSLTTPSITDYHIMEDVWNQLLLHEDSFLALNCSAPDKIKELCPQISIMKAPILIKSTSRDHSETSNEVWSKNKSFWCMWKTLMRCFITISSSFLNVNISLAGRKPDHLYAPFTQVMASQAHRPLEWGQSPAYGTWLGRGRQLGANRRGVVSPTLNSFPFSANSAWIESEKFQDRPEKMSN